MGLVSFADSVIAIRTVFLAASVDFVVMCRKVLNTVQKKFYTQKKITIWGSTNESQTRLIDDCKVLLDWMSSFQNETYFIFKRNHLKIGKYTPNKIIIGFQIKCVE